MTAATLLPVPSVAEIASLADRCGWALDALYRVNRAQIRGDAIGLVRAGSVTLLRELAAAMEDAGNGVSCDAALALAFEVRDQRLRGHRDDLLAGVGWCRDLAASLRVEVASG